MGLENEIYNGFSLLKDNKCCICGCFATVYLPNGNMYCKKHGVNRIFPDVQVEGVGVDIEK